MNVGRCFLALMVIFVSSKSPIYGIHIEDLSSSAVDAMGQKFFMFNPAGPYQASGSFAALAYKGRRSSSVIGSPGANQQEINYETRIESMGFGLNLPIGGAAFGLQYSETKESLTAVNNVNSRQILEDTVDTDLAFRFMVELTQTLRGGFLYQVRVVENDIFGSFFLSNEDRTEYKGQLSGYRLGLFYEHDRYRAGIYTAPPLRGKGNIQGEDKIMTEPGTSGLDFAFHNGAQVTLGFAFTRWHYKKDDRARLSTSGIDQRSISLNGTDLRQYLLKTNEYRLGGEYALRPEFILSLGYGRSMAVFHFDENAVPGDDRDDETEVAISRYMLGARLIKAQFSLDLNYYLESLAHEEIRDSTRKLGHGDYRDYSSRQTAIVLNFSIKY